MQFIEEEIRVVADFVTLTVMKLPLDQEYVPSPRFGHDAEVRTRVNMDAPDWNGSLHFACSKGFARRAAAALFEKEVDMLTDDEEEDAVGELANMIAGGIKPELPNHITLDVPKVDREPEFKQANGRVLTKVHLSCAGEQFEIALYDKGD